VAKKYLSSRRYMHFPTQANKPLTPKALSKKHFWIKSYPSHRTFSGYPDVTETLNSSKSEKLTTIPLTRVLTKRFIFHFWNLLPIFLLFILICYNTVKKSEIFETVFERVLFQNGTSPNVTWRGRGVKLAKKCQLLFDWSLRYVWNYKQWI